MEKELVIPLLKAIAKFHLEYCIQAWRPYRKKDRYRLERIQRRATKMIQRGDKTEVFMILNGCENIDRNILLSLKKDSRTPGREVTIVEDQCRLDIRKYSFSL